MTIGVRKRLNLRGTEALLALLVVSTALDSAALIWRFSVHDPGLRATTETASTAALLLSAWLLRSRFLESRRLSDLLPPVGLLMLGLANLEFEGAGEMLGVHASSSSVSAEVTARLLVAVCFGAAALLPRWTFTPRSRMPRVIVAAALLSISALAAAGWSLGAYSPSASQLRVVLSTADFVVAAAAAAILLAAGVALLLKAARVGEQMPGILGAFSVLTAGAWLYGLPPATASLGTVSTADLLEVLTAGLMGARRRRRRRGP
jgi:hypothetical protein